MTGLVERLRSVGRSFELGADYSIERLCIEAADRIEQLEGALMPQDYYSLVHDLLLESQAHICPTESNFDDDMALALKQTRVAISKAGKAS